MTTDVLERPLEGLFDQMSSMSEKVYAAAKPGAVFGEPIRRGDLTVVMATEVVSGGGFGFGAGGGRDGKVEGASTGTGAGGGGGGGARGRPVAVIEIRDDGVTIKPIVDTTKLVLAGITASIGMAAMWFRMRRAMT
jgi:uncharacterized spore protein YtfJ